MTTKSELLDALDELLSITEQFLPNMTKDEKQAWLNISASTADARELWEDYKKS